LDGGQFPANRPTKKAEMAAIATMQPDITLLLDMEGVIREATLSPAMRGESVDGWLGRPWVEIAGDLATKSSA
jgi:hypothetical protein